VDAIFTTLGKLYEFLTLCVGKIAFTFFILRKGLICMNCKQNKEEVRSKFQTIRLTAEDQNLFKKNCFEELKKRPGTVLREYVEKFNKVRGKK